MQLSSYLSTLDFSKALCLSGNCAGDTSTTCHKPFCGLVCLMRLQLLSCSHALLGKLSHMGAKVIQEKHYQCAQLRRLALPLVLNSAHSLGTSIPGGHSAKGHLYTSQCRLALALQLLVHVLCGKLGS